VHILLIHQAFAALNEPGGTRHHELARFLAAAGHQVTVIASPVSYLTGQARAASAPEVEEFPAGGLLTIRRAATYAALHRSFFHRILSFLSFMASSFWIGLGVGGVDVVWGTSPPIFQGATAWLLARLKGARFLFEVRDLWPAFAVQVGVLRQPLLIWLAEALERFLYRHADQVMVNSPGFVAHVQGRGARAVRLIPNGADAAMFDPAADGAAFRQRHGLTGAFVALYAGAHGMSNDLGVLLAAAALLADAPNFHLVLLGDGKEKPNLQRQAAALGLERVHFLDPLPKDAMAEALAACDAAVAILKPIPLYGTVYPNKVFDYLAAGRPVVCAIDGVIREVVESGPAGIFVPPGDPAALAAALRRLQDDPAWAHQLGANGRRLIETRFDRRVLAGELLDLLRELAGAAD
jgi:glycosyltransferase involved in cell wall biosynthesis